MNTELWRPSPDRISRSLLADFIRTTGVGYGPGGYDYEALWRHSVENPEEFWSDVWEICGVIGSRGETVLRRDGELYEAEFFPDSSLNYSENLLRNMESEGRLIFHAESGDRRELSRPDLVSLVAKLQQALQNDGVGVGDRVVGVLPNTPETVAIMLAVSSLGAVWSSCSPDFGKAGIVDRFGQLQPKVMFCTDGYFYNGKWFDVLETALEVAKEVQSIRGAVVSPYGGLGSHAYSSADGMPRALSDYISDLGQTDLQFERVGFRDPGFVLFSSGTTGLPKCIVHSVGGTLLQHMKEHQLQCDIGAGDRVLFFTTCGWMMWNWLVSAMASGASLVLYDGSPLYADPDRLARIAHAEGVTHFGASAKYFDACAKARVRPVETCSLDELRTILSTGSPLSPECFDYLYSNWKSDVCLSSIAGGTDIIGCFVGGSPISPVFRGQCQKRYLGMDVRVFSQDGKECVGTPGELVCASPHPSIPVGFLNDPSNSRFRKAYFERFPGTWHHGDWVELTAEGGLVFYGRSDATLNPGGVRIGTAEIYRPVEQIDEVVESLVVGLSSESDVKVVLFVKLRPGHELTNELMDTIRSEIRAQASPRHVPSEIFSVPDIPRTKSGKIVELAVKDILEGREVRNTEALANPEALSYFRNAAV